MPAFSTEHDVRMRLEIPKHFGASPRRARTWSCVLLAVGVLATASGCNTVLSQPVLVGIDSDGTRAAGLKYDASGQTHTKQFDAAYYAFVPQTIRMHPGDKAFFRVASFGSYYILALGTLVNSAANAINGVGSETSQATIESLPAVRRLPTLFPTTTDPTTVPVLNQSAAEPCYLNAGTPPVSPQGGAPACPSRPKPEFDGTQSFYSSGILQNNAQFTLQLAKDIKPGTYDMIDLVHPWLMRGTIVVVPERVNLPWPGDVTSAGSRETSGLSSQLQDAATAAWTATPNKAVAGASGPGVPGVVLSFGPTYRVRVGQKVSWHVAGMQTITFDPTSQARKGLIVKRKGRFEINAVVWRAAGSPTSVVTAQGPSGESMTVDAGAWNGSGFENSGLLQAGANGLTYSLTFTRAGTYHYHSLIYPAMHGTVIVR
jgi:plastocyanin